MSFLIIQNDITTMPTDAIVNAANAHLRMGGGVCGAIFLAAGAAKLQQACDQYGFCPTGEAVITEGFDLPAKYVIHAVGPIWQGGDNNEESLLKSAYRNSLELAKKYGCRSISFPLISSGIYGYPKRKAFETAAAAINDFLKDNEMYVYLIVLDKDVLEHNKNNCK